MAISVGDLCASFCNIFLSGIFSRDPLYAAPITLLLCIIVAVFYGFSVNFISKRHYISRKRDEYMTEK